MFCTPGAPCDMHTAEPRNPDKCPGCCDWIGCRAAGTVSIADTDGSISRLVEVEDCLDDFYLCADHFIHVAKTLEKELNHNVH